MICEACGWDITPDEHYTTESFDDGSVVFIHDDCGLDCT